MLITGPASAGVALIAGATLAGAWLARRAAMMRAASLACAAGLLLAVVLADLLPDVWRDLPGAGLPWWAAAAAVAAGIAGTDILARRGCACRTGPDRGEAAAAALGVHRALEGAALVLAGSLAVVAALVVHAGSEGFALTALLRRERRAKTVTLLAIMCLSPAIGAIVMSQIRLPAQAAPITTAVVAGVLARAAVAAGQAARQEWLAGRADRDPEAGQIGFWTRHAKGRAANDIWRGDL